MSGEGRSTSRKEGGGRKRSWIREGCREAGEGSEAGNGVRDAKPQEAVGWLRDGEKGRNGSWHKGAGGERKTQMVTSAAREGPWRTTIDAKGEKRRAGRHRKESRRERKQEAGKTSRGKAGHGKNQGEAASTGEKQDGSWIRIGPRLRNIWELKARNLGATGASRGRVQRGTNKTGAQARMTKRGKREKTEVEGQNRDEKGANNSGKREAALRRERKTTK